MITIEYVSRRPISTISGLMTFGKISRVMIRHRVVPRSSTDLT